MGARTPEGAKDITTAVSPNANSKDYDGHVGLFLAMRPSLFRHTYRALPDS